MSGAGVLRLGSRAFGVDEAVVMGILNRTPDSFYRPGDTWDTGAAREHAAGLAEQGADVVDIGGTPGKPGAAVSVAEEVERVVPLIGELRATHPDLVISVDTWRAEVAREACAAGADLVNDTWGGWDRGLPAVAAEFGAGLVCSHAGPLTPRTRPFRVTYDDVVDDVRTKVVAAAERAEREGVRPDGILIDPTHDFGKNTWHSLELTRRLGELTDQRWPVLVALSNKDFVGETLDRPDPADRGAGTLAALSVSAWLGARVFRVHHVREARDALDMVRTIQGRRLPARTVRGMA